MMSSSQARKMQQKKYYKQTTRPGSLKAINMESIVRKWGGGEVLKRAVRGMLPKNRLRDPRLERLKGEYFMVTRLTSGFAGFGIGVGSLWTQLANRCNTLVFEGEAHPYKANLMRVNGKLRMSEPEISVEKLKVNSI